MQSILFVDGLSTIRPLIYRPEWTLDEYNLQWVFRNINIRNRNSSVYTSWFVGISVGQRLPLVKWGFLHLPSDSTSYASDISRKRRLASSRFSGFLSGCHFNANFLYLYYANLFFFSNRQRKQRKSIRTEHNRELERDRKWHLMWMHTYAFFISVSLAVLMMPNVR